MNTKTFFRREINSDISSSRSKKIVSDLSAPSAPDHNSGNTNGLQVGTPKTMCPRSSAPDSVGSFSQDRQDIGARHLIAHTNFTIYPFTTSDLALLVWADWHHPPAAAAIVAAENKATDDPSYRDKANAYIRDCLAAIRRRQECVEKADDMLWGFAMQEKWKRDRMSCKDGYGGQDFDNVENFELSTYAVNHGLWKLLKPLQKPVGATHRQESWIRVLDCSGPRRTRQNAGHSQRRAK